MQVQGRVTPGAPLRDGNRRSAAVRTAGLALVLAVLAGACRSGREAAPPSSPAGGGGGATTSLPGTSVSEPPPADPDRGNAAGDAAAAPAQRPAGPGVPGRAAPVRAGLPGGCSAEDPPAQDFDRGLTPVRGGFAFTRLLAEGQKPAIYVADVHGGNVRPFIPCGVAASGPAWSPDGSRLAFLAGMGDDAEVHVVASDGSGLRRLTSNDVPEAAVSWSPDGRRLLFVVVPRGARNVQEVHVLDTGTGESRALTTGTLDLQPRFTPDGSRIVFVRIDGATHESGVWEMNADGTGQQRILPQHSGVTWPQYSPDGRRVLLSDGRTLFTVAPDGSDKRTLVTLTRDVRDAVNDPRPAWAPDGGSVVFNQLRRGARDRSDVWVVGADGTGLRRLTESPGLDVDPEQQPQR